MNYPERAKAVWFGRGTAQDVHFLKAWHEAPLTYSPEQPIDHNWNADRYEVILGQDSTGAIFDRAARLVLRNQFYPREVMTNVSDFGLENRPVQTGDRILQRILIAQYRGLPILEVLTMNEITQVIDEPRRVGFTYTTTAAHSEIGEWSPLVEWRENGEVALVISVVSRSLPGTSAFARSFSRRMQLRAHRLSIANFKARLNGIFMVPASQPADQAARLLPVGLLLLAALLLMLRYTLRKTANH